MENLLSVAAHSRLLRGWRNKYCIASKDASHILKLNFKRKNEIHRNRNLCKKLKDKLDGDKHDKMKKDFLL